MGTASRRGRRVASAGLGGRACVAAWACAAFLAGCALFRPTEPEPPQGEVLIPDLSEPERTLETVALAIEDKGRTNGLSVYEDSFVPELAGTGYRAYHLPGVIQSYQAGGGTVPPNWTRELERGFYSGLIQLDSDEFEAFWSPDPRNEGLEVVDIAADTACLYREYTIQSRGPTTTTTVAHGFAYLSFFRNNSGDWQILRWQDIPGEPEDPESETMGALRLELR
jgi:hypothetical protein